MSKNLKMTSQQGQESHAGPNEVQGDPQAAPDSLSMDPAGPSAQWSPHEDYHTLVKAHEIQNHPHRMKAVHELVGRHKAAITSIEQLENVAKEKLGTKQNPPKLVKGTKNGSGKPQGTGGGPNEMAEGE